jgi:hypothetical protein
LSARRSSRQLPAVNEHEQSVLPRRILDRKQGNQDIYLDTLIAGMLAAAVKNKKKRSNFPDSRELLGGMQLAHDPVSARPALNL